MTELPETRQSLLLRLGQNSDHAWTEFLGVYEDAIYRFCRRQGLQDADAQDVTQEVFSAVLGKIDDWNPDKTKGTFRGWLLRVARNIAVSRIRLRSRPDGAAAGDTINLTTLAEVPDGHKADAVENFEFEYRRAAFQWAAKIVQQEVRNITWQSFWRTAVENIDPSLVANQLDISVGSVYTGKCRVVARLRERVSELAGADPIDLDDQLFQQMAREETD